MGALEPALGWLAGVLWPESAGLRAVVDGVPPHGFQVVRSYLVVPSLERARFLLPAGSRRGAVGALRSFNPLREPKARAVRSALAVAIGAGTGRMAFRDRMDVCAREEDESTLPEARLESLLGVPVEIAIGVGRQGPNRKPTLQVFSQEGLPLAYAKVGWNGFTERLVRSEAAMLRAMSEARPRGLAAPALLHAERWRDLELCLAGPLPNDARRLPSHARPPIDVLRALVGICGSTVTAALERSAYAERLRTRVSGLPEGPGRAAAAAALDASLARWGDREVVFGSWHGDLVPWNLARTRTGHAAWDWEHGGADVPVGLDAFHWHFQVAFTGERNDLGRAVAACAGGAAGADALGQSADAPMLALYLLELFLRYEQAAAAGAGRNPRLAGLGEALRGAIA